MIKNIKDYRPCVGVMLINQDKKVLVGQRIDNPADAWQMPQGGVDDGEDFEKAIYRELMEEIGTDKAAIITQLDDWLYYDLPPELKGKLWGGKFIGQRQRWFLMQFTGKDADINIQTAHPEFKAWKWVDPSMLDQLIVPFKREVYKKVLSKFNKFLS